jgi:hypothetical protein
MKKCNNIQPSVIRLLGRRQAHTLVHEQTFPPGADAELANEPSGTGD